MSKVSSYRFEEKSQMIMDILNERYGISEKTIIELALDHLYDEYIEKYRGENVIVVDFKNNLDGINSEIVDKFIDEVTSNTKWKVYMWADGDEVQFIREEEI